MVTFKTEFMAINTDKVFYINNGLFIIFIKSSNIFIFRL